MTNELVRIAPEAVGDVLAEIEAAYLDVPFGNSDFQNRAFVMAAEHTPARAFRAIGLRMFDRIRALKESAFQERLTAIDIEEKEARIADPDTSDFDRRRLRIEIEKILDGKTYADKLKGDALRELECLYAEFKKLPHYTREQFEAEEHAHFQERLTRQLNQNGAQQSLANMSVDLPQMPARSQHAIAELRRIGLLKE
jgi:hypothetical protein